MNRVRVPILFLFALLLAVTVAAPASAQAEFTCDTGQVITNGVQFRINVRPGDYRATAIGLNGFDPVFAAVETGTVAHLCNDDEPNAAGYAGVLPSTGDFTPSGLTAQLTFNNPTNDFMDIDLVVGGLNGQGGEFVLLFEGMQVTEADGSGDPFAVVLNPSLIASNVGIHAYVIHVDAQFDPLLFVADENLEPLQTDAGPVICDDASNAESCFVISDTVPVVSLEGYGLTDGENTVTGDPYDPYFSVPGEALANDIPELLFMVTGAQYQQGMSTGEYIFAIHTGVAGPGGSANTGNTGNVIPPGQPGGSVTTTADVTPIQCTETGVGELLGQGQEDQFLNVQCPANCSGNIWGTNIYTDDSAVCAAAVHAGVIPANGGAFAVVIGPGQTSYEGSTQNGITSSSWGEWGRSFIPMPVIDDSSTGTSTGNTGSPSGNTGSSSNTTADVSLQPIAYGDQLSAQVSSVAGDAYSFNASARDVVTIAVNSDDFDPLIIVTDTNGRELTRDDDSGPGFNALVSNLRIPSAGEYLIVITSLSGVLDVGTPYTIELSGG